MRRWTTVIGVFIAWLYTLPLTRGSSNLGETSTIPRSTPTRRNYDSSQPQHQRPPWNPSPLIDEDGFLKCLYYRIPGEWEEEAQLTGKHGTRGPENNHKNKRQRTWEEVPVTIRQVPGDGNCLFHSIAICWAHAVNGTHIRLKAVSGNGGSPGGNSIATDDSRWLYECSASLRQRAVECLAGGQRLLFLQGKEFLRAKDLVEAAASQYGLTGKEYCHLMRKDSYWGGGPEIVALVNVLRRPIHVYELCSSSGNQNGRGDGGRFWLRRMACFGSPKFDRREPLHILSADSRFPDVEPGKQLASGNHFLAMFPASGGKSNAKKQGVRGGNVDDSSNNSNLVDQPWPANPYDEDDVSFKDKEKNLFQLWWERLTSFLEGF